MWVSAVSIETYEGEMFLNTATGCARVTGDPDSLEKKYLLVTFIWAMHFAAALWGQSLPPVCSGRLAEGLVAVGCV